MARAPTPPVQEAISWSGLPLTGSFTRDFETQTTIPLDGSAGSGRVYSPFVLRVLLPSVLGDNGENTLLTGASLTGSPGVSSDPVRRSNRGSSGGYSEAVRGAAQATPSTSSYAALSALGGALPGLDRTSVAVLQQTLDQAHFEDLRAPQVQASARGGGGGSSSPVRRQVRAARATATDALDMVLQLKKIANTPPLLLLINPSSMSIDYTKVAQFSDRSRNGYIYHAWGHELTRLSLSFRIGAYYSGSATGAEPGRGMSRASRNDSAAFQQLQALLTLYQSSGYLQARDGSRAYPLVGNISIEYDQKVYVGHMDSFSFGEEETNQNGGLQVEVAFTAVREFDLAPRVGTPLPMTNPNGATGTPRGTLSRSVPGNAGGSQLFTAPTVGLAGSARDPQPWSGASVTTGTPPSPLLSRR